MTALDALRSALEALRRNVLRTLLTALGVVIGTGAVIVMIAVGAGARERLLEQIRSLGSNLIVVSPGTATVGGARLGAGSRQTLTIDDAGAIVRDIASVQVAAPVVRGSAQVVAANVNWSTMLLGANMDFLEAREWPIASGRGFTREETEGAGKVVILGRSVAEALFGAAEPVGQTVRVQMTPLRVVGVLDRKGQNTQGTDQDDVAIVPLSTARDRILGISLANSRAVGAIVTRVRQGENLTDAEQQIRDLLRQRHRRSADQDDDFSIRNLSEVMVQRDASARMLTLLLGAVAGVSLLVGGIGIMNVMLVSVTERTREIGLRRSLGARRRDILVQFLIEAGTLSGLGGAVGIALGSAVAALVAGLAGWPIVIGLEVLALAAGCSIAIGIFFGFYPARRAAHLQPATALHHE
jgi:putative ABC transport system permease protein